MADRNQHPSRDDETHRAVFGPVDLQTAELEIDSSIYNGFAAAIMVKGQPRTVALTREYGDAVQLMALIERGRTAPSAASGDGASLADYVYCPPDLSCVPIAEVASKHQGCGAIYAAAYDSIRKGAPGLSEATCAAIARSINMKAALRAAPVREEGGAMLAFDLRCLKEAFEQIAARPPEDQPHYKSGVRPFGTGDLRHIVDVLTKAAALAALQQEGR